MMDMIADYSVKTPIEAYGYLREATLSSQSRAIVQSLMECATEISVERGYAPASRQSLDMFYKANEIANNINDSTEARSWSSTAESHAKLSMVELEGNSRMTDPAEVEELVSRAKLGYRVATDPVGIQIATTTYLESEFRRQPIDRRLLIAMLDLEITDYLRNVYDESVSPEFRSKPLEIRQAFSNWIMGRGWASFRLVAILVVVQALGAVGWLNPQMCSVLTSSSVLLYAISCLVSLFRSRRLWRESQRLRVTLPTELMSFYRELHSTKSLNTKRVRQEAERLSRAGAVWLRLIWPLLDDIESRGVVALAN